MPFQNQMVSVTLTGAQLREVLEDAINATGPDAHIAGLTVTFDATRPAGHRVLEVRLSNGKKLKDRDRYSLATSSFLAAGQGGYTVLRDAPQSTAGMNDIEAVELYLRRIPRPVRPPEDARFIPAHR
jgi:5'-nucleotidase